jgi:hypothetical protein
MSRVAVRIAAPRSMTLRSRNTASGYPGLRSRYIQHRLLFSAIFILRQSHVDWLFPNLEEGNVSISVVYLDS